jgi:hypothetical protein
MRYKYEIWTKYKHIDDRSEDAKPSLWVECKTMEQVGRYLDLSIGQVRSRMSWSRNVELGLAWWHVKPSGIMYQILRKKLTY